MSHEQCKYHPESPAAWYCEHCDIGYCLRCKPIQQNKPAQCPVCRKRLHSQGIRKIATPFWHRMPAFFAYPFNWQSIWFTLTMLCLMFITGFMPFFAFKILALIFTGGTFFHYLFSVLRQSANGRFNEPVPVHKAFHGDSFKDFFAIIGVFLFAIASIKSVDNVFGTIISTPFSLLVLLCLPASIMILIANESFLGAINPGKWLQLILIIGWPYLILFALIALTSFTADHIAAMVLGKVKIGFVNLCLSMLLQTYFSVQIFNMLGYVLYQYHHELGYPVSEDTIAQNHTPTPQGKATPPKHPALIELDILLAEGRLEDGKQTLLAALEQEQENLELMQALHKLAQALQDTHNLPSYTNHLLALQLQQGKTAMTTETLRQTRQLCPDYQIDQPELAYNIARQAYQAGQYQQAIDLLNGLHQRSPYFDQLVDAYLLVAKSFSEGLGDDASALKVLQFLQQQYADHPNIAAVNQYAEVVTKVASFSKS